MKTALLDRKPICNDFVWWRVELSTVDRFSLGMDHYLFKGKRGGGGGRGGQFRKTCFFTAKKKKMLKRGRGSMKQS